MRQQTDLEILSRGEGWVAIHKPAGLAAIPGRGQEDSVIERLADQLGLPASGSADPRVRVVHRLDLETSGVMLFALNSAVQRHLSHQFQNNTTEKEYLALVRGHPTDLQGEIDAPIGPHPTSAVRMAILKHGGRPARTGWRVEATFRDYSLLRVFPKTGKTHQIRVHLASIGLPLAIDPLYARKNARPGIYLSDFKRDFHAGRHEERPLIDRLTLHAEKLRFKDISAESVELVAPLPKDFRAVLNMLGKYSRR